MKFKRLNSNAGFPYYATNGSAGFDIAASEEVCIMPGDSVMVATGLAFQLDPYTEMQIRPRSGMSAKTKIRISNAPGTIDSDFRGEVKILLDNIGHLPYNVKIGDRIAQGVVAPVLQVEIQLVEELDETERGLGSFGSTGV